MSVLTNWSRQPDGRVIYNGQPASTFGGEGVKIREVTVEGPLEDTWPPQRTQDLFPNVQLGTYLVSESRKTFEGSS